jgi:hypothetical protein
VLYTVILVALAAVSGFVFGKRRSRWPALGAYVALAFLSALVFRKSEFSAGIGIPAVAAVLTVSQVAYLIALLLDGDPGQGLPDQQVDDVPDDGRDDDVSGEHEGH